MPLILVAKLINPTNYAMVTNMDGVISFVYLVTSGLGFISKEASTNNGRFGIVRLLFVVLDSVIDDAVLALTWRCPSRQSRGSTPPLRRKPKKEDQMREGEWQRLPFHPGWN